MHTVMLQKSKDILDAELLSFAAFQNELSVND
jgi:hypothetical protein